MQTKKNPFIPYITPYLDWLGKHFNHLVQQTIDYKISPGNLARDYLSDSSRREKFQESLPIMFNNINNFWQSSFKKIKNEIDLLPGIKARFGGDIGPQNDDSIFQSTGLYFDTIIVPDPLLKIAHIPKSIAKINDYYFLKYAIELVLAKEVYLTDTYPPIAVLTADHSLVGGADFEKLGNLAKLDLILLTNDLYNRNFTEYEESIEFYKSFSSLKEAVNEIVKPELFFLMEDAPRDPLNQLEANLERERIDWKMEGVVDYDDSYYLPFLFQGRLMQINDILDHSLIQSSHPIISAPVSFHWLKWKLISNQERIFRELDIFDELNLGLTNALLSEDLRWLSNVSLDGLINLRRLGKLSELRKIISSEIHSLSNLEFDGLSRVVNQVDYNLSVALSNHQNEINDLDRKLRSELLLSGPSLLVSVVAAIQPSLFPFSSVWMRSIGYVLGSTSLLDVVKSIVEYTRERKKLSTSPVGLLWTAKKK